MDTGAEHLISTEHKASDMSISTFIHLLGVPTKDELNILDKKIDLIVSRLDSVVSKINMLSSDLSTGSLSSTLERIDEQLLSIKEKINL
jgi:hypothetical protein